MTRTATLETPSKDNAFGLCLGTFFCPMALLSANVASSVAYGAGISFAAHFFSPMGVFDADVFSKELISVHSLQSIFGVSDVFKFDKSEFFFLFLEVYIDNFSELVKNVLQISNFNLGGKVGNEKFRTFSSATHEFAFLF